MLALVRSEVFCSFTITSAPLLDSPVTTVTAVTSPSLSQETAKGHHQTGPNQELTGRRCGGLTRKRAVYKEKPTLTWVKPGITPPQENLSSPYESGGQEFESLRARHFGTKLGTQKPAVFALEAATRVRSSTLFDPMMRTSSASTSTRWASARRWSRR